MLKEEKIWHPRLGLASQGDEEKDGTKSRGAHGVHYRRKEKKRNV